MVKTDGINGGITSSISKGIKGKNIRYNVDDRTTKYFSISKKYGDNFEELNRAKIKDIEFYLGSDWIDWRVVKYGVNDTSFHRIESNSKVFRCGSCGNAYQTKTIGTSGKLKGNSHLRSSIFNNVPIEKGECGICV